MVSICMITYGQETYIRQAIEGALMQETAFDFELVIVNDCSPDDTHTIINSYITTHPKGKNIRHIRHEKNKGMMSNFLFALAQCTQKYVALCEGDDYWTAPDKLQKQVDFLEAHPDYSICFHQVKLLHGVELMNDWITKPPGDDTNIQNLIEHRNYIHTPSVVFRNRELQFPAAFSLSPVGDYFLYILLTQDGSKIKYLKEVMAVYRYGVGIYGQTTEYEQLWNWYNTVFLINSCLAPKYKTSFAVMLNTTKFQLENYAFRHIATADYLIERVPMKELIKAIKLNLSKKLKKKFRKST